MSENRGPSLCRYAGACGGCDWIAQDPNLQIDSKRAGLERLLGFADIRFVKTLAWGARSRMDLTVEVMEGKVFVGLFRLRPESRPSGQGGSGAASAAVGPEGVAQVSTVDRMEGRAQNSAVDRTESPENSILDIEDCAQLEPKLRQLFRDFRVWAKEHLSNISTFRKGSVRLRVDHLGRPGIWLDFSNIAVRDLLADPRVLESLMAMGGQSAVVEIGQRRKVLAKTVEGYRLRDPELHPWFTTYLFSKFHSGKIPQDRTQNLLAGGFSEHRVIDEEIDSEPKVAPLYLSVGGFSQPSREGNEQLIKSVLQMAWSRGISSWCDLFCGSGNFTLPLLGCGWEVFAVEREEAALEGLLRSAREIKMHGKLQTRALDLQSRGRNRGVLKSAISEAKFGVLVNPPRSGILELYDELVELMPDTIIYVSCFPESLASDVGRLKDVGYSIERVSIVDQFPETHHFESVVLLVRTHADEST